MSGGFGDVDGDWAAWEGDHGGWMDAGLDAVERCLGRDTFTTVDVWAAWVGERPDEPRRMAEVMDEAIRLGWCARSGPVGGHTRQAGHAGFGALYVPVRADSDAAVEQRPVVGVRSPR